MTKLCQNEVEVVAILVDNSVEGHHSFGEVEQECSKIRKVET